MTTSFYTDKNGIVWTITGSPGLVWSQYDAKAPSWMLETGSPSVASYPYNPNDPLHQDSPSLHSSNLASYADGPIKAMIDTYASGHVPRQPAPPPNTNPSPSPNPTPSPPSAPSAQDVLAGKGGMATVLFYGAVAIGLAWYVSQNPKPQGRRLAHG